MSPVVGLVDWVVTSGSGLGRGRGGRREYIPVGFMAASLLPRPPRPQPNPELDTDG
ncbi:hypothetical protein Thiosp_04414 [Thiorhodovibrio litoralis]|nr:hypothetical protein Thiosp_04414 [Thiorhodovibrio litoralis]